MDRSRSLILSVLAGVVLCVAAVVLIDRLQQASGLSHAAAPAAAVPLTGAAPVTAIYPLVGWALVQRGGESEVVGLVASDNKVALCDDQADFTGYVFLPDALPNDFEVEQDLFAAEDLDEDDFDDDDFDDDDDLDGTSGNGPAFNPKAGRLN